MTQDLKQAIDESRHHIDNYLTEQLNALPPVAPRLLDAMRHGLLAGGKRIRPLLVYLCGDLVGVDKDKLAPVAAAIESIHAYSLIHDDLPAMDDDALRRGLPTCHVAFDEATAILAGDALQSFAFEQLGAIQQLCPTTHIRLFQELAKAAGYQGMCSGQALDIAATGRNINIESLEQIHRFKTGALITSSIILGAIASGITKKDELSNLNDYAQSIGLAFQVQDDILDVISDTNTLGKPQGSDQAANKKTYPDLLGLEGAQKKANTLLEQAQSALTRLPYDTRQLSMLAEYIVCRQQ